MDFALTPPQLDLQRRAHDFAAREIAPGAAARDQAEAVDRRLFIRLAEQGWMGALWPTTLGGSALTYLDLALIGEQIAGACLSTAIALAIHTCLASMSIYEAGDDAQRQRWMRLLASGGALGAFALTEPDAGSDPGGLSATLTRAGDRLILNGVKTWVSNAGLAEAFVVFASHDLTQRHRAITALVIEAGTPGLALGLREATLGLRAADIRTVTFENVVVAPDAVLGRLGDGWPIILRAFDRVRVVLAAAALGAAAGAVALGVEYASTRRQFGTQIGYKQAVQAYLAESQMEVEALRGLVYRAAWLADRGEPFGLAGAQAKAFGARVANAVADRMLQVHGGAGFNEALPIARVYRDVRALRLLGGTDEIQRYVVARALLEPHGVRIQP